MIFYIPLKFERQLPMASSDVTSSLQSFRVQPFPGLSLLATQKPEMTVEGFRIIAVYSIPPLNG